MRRGQGDHRAFKRPRGLNRHENAPNHTEASLGAPSLLRSISFLSETPACDPGVKVANAGAGVSSPGFSHQLADVSCISQIAPSNRVIATGEVWATASPAPPHKKDAAAAQLQNMRSTTANNVTTPSNFLVGSSVSSVVSAPAVESKGSGHRISDIAMDAAVASSSSDASEQVYQYAMLPRDKIDGATAVQRNSTNIVIDTSQARLLMSRRSVPAPEASPSPHATAAKVAYPGFRLPADADPTSIHSWGLDATIVANVLELRITNLYEWQARCLQRPFLMLDYAASRRSDLDTSLSLSSAPAPSLGEVRDVPQSLIYSAPTSGGKSLVADILILKRLIEEPQRQPSARPEPCLVRKNTIASLTNESNGPKVLVCLPFKALVEEKCAYYKRITRGMTPNVKVVGLCGNKMNVVANNATIVVATYERANGLLNTLMEEKKLTTLQSVVVDEVHMIGDTGRGFYVESIIAKALWLKRREIARIQLICMSATIPNLQELANWAECDLFVEADFRPVPLKEYLLVPAKGPTNAVASVAELYTIDYADKIRTVSGTPSSSLRISDPSNDHDGVLALLISLASRKKQALLFAPTINSVENHAGRIAGALERMAAEEAPRSVCATQRVEFSERLRQYGCKFVAATVKAGVASHHAKLPLEVRTMVEQAFLSGIIHVIVATSTLAVGVNLPVDTVVFLSPRIGPKYVSPQQYMQMAGRAGRTGHTERGQSIVAISTLSEGRAFVHSLNAAPGPVSGQINESNNLGFMLEMFAHKYGAKIDDADEWWRCTKYGFEHLARVDDSLTRLCQFNLIVKDTNGAYMTRELGLAAARAGIDPLQASVTYSEILQSCNTIITGTILHILYIVMPLWEVALNWEEFHQATATVRSIDSFAAIFFDKVGIDHAVVERLRVSSFGWKARGLPPGVAPLVFEKHQRLFTTMIIYLFLQGRDESALRKFGPQVSELPTILQACATNAYKITVFSQQLRWWSIAAAARALAKALRLRRESEHHSHGTGFSPAETLTFRHAGYTAAKIRMLATGAASSRDLADLRNMGPYCARQDKLHPTQASQPSCCWSGLYFMSQIDSAYISKLHNLSASRPAAPATVTASDVNDDAESISDSDSDASLISEICSLDEAKRIAMGTDEAVMSPNDAHVLLIEDGSDETRDGLPPTPTDPLDCSVWHDPEICSLADSDYRCSSQPSQVQEEPKKMSSIDPHVPLFAVAVSPVVSESVDWPTLAVSTCTSDGVLGFCLLRRPPTRWASPLAPGSTAKALRLIAEFVGFRGIPYHQCRDMNASLMEAVPPNRMQAVCRSWRDAFCARFYASCVDVACKLERALHHSSIMLTFNAPDTLQHLWHFGVHAQSPTYDATLAYWLLNPDECVPKDIAQMRSTLLALESLNPPVTKKLPIAEQASAVKLGLEAGKKASRLEYRCRELCRSAVDVCVLYSKLLGRLEDRSLMTTYDSIEIPYVRALSMMQCRGLMCDYNRVLANIQKLRHALDGLTTSINRILDGAGWLAVQTFNMSSPIHLRQALNLLAPEAAKHCGAAVSSEQLKTLRDTKGVSVACRHFCDLINEWRRLQPFLAQMQNILKHRQPSQDSTCTRISYKTDLFTATGRTVVCDPPLQTICNGFALKRYPSFSVHEELMGSTTCWVPQLKLASPVPASSMIGTKAAALFTGDDSGCGLTACIIRKVDVARTLLDTMGNASESLVAYWRRRGYVYSDKEASTICQITVEIEGGRTYTVPADKVYREGSLAFAPLASTRPACPSWCKYWNVTEMLYPRRCFVAPASFQLLSVDYSQIEVRMLAHLAGDPKLISCLTTEMDVFTTIAAEWHGKPVSSISSRERDTTKKLVYGILYGMGPRALASALDIAQAEAKMLMEQFKRTFSVSTEFLYRTVCKCRKEGYVETITGRRRYLSNIAHVDVDKRLQAERRAINTVCQGSAADLMKMAVCSVTTAIGAFNTSAELVKPLLTVHDEIILEVHPAIICEVVGVVRQCMEAVMPLKVPLRVSLQVGSNWGEMRDWQ